MNVQRWMSVRFFLFFMGWGIFLPYWTGYLVDGKNLSIEQASVIMSIGLLMRGLSTITLYPMMKKPRVIYVSYSGSVRRPFCLLVAISQHRAICRY